MIETGGYDSFLEFLEYQQILKKRNETKRNKMIQITGGPAFSLQKYLANGSDLYHL